MPAEHCVFSKFRWSAGIQTIQHGRSCHSIYPILLHTLQVRRNSCCCRSVIVLHWRHSCLSTAAVFASFQVFLDCVSVGCFCSARSFLVPRNLSVKLVKSFFHDYVLQASISCPVLLSKGLFIKLPRSAALLCTKPWPISMALTVSSIIYHQIIRPTNHLPPPMPLLHVWY